MFGAALDNLLKETGIELNSLLSSAKTDKVAQQNNKQHNKKF